MTDDDNDDDAADEYLLDRTIVTNSTAQGSGGSFKIGNLKERLVVVNHGWQSEATGGSIYLH